MGKIIFKAGYLMKRPAVIRYYNHFQKTQWQTSEWLKEQQEEQLRKLINYAYESVPYYTKLFDESGLKPSDIGAVEDLEKLPILTKRDIKDNDQDFIPRDMDGMKYFNCSTGGSTGEPLKYRMSVDDYERGFGLLYRGFGYGGYKLGDKIAIIAGSSLIPAKKSDLKRSMQEFFLNFRHYSSFEMSEENLYKYFREINKWKPDFIRGYASSVYLFSKYISDNALKLEFRPKAIFTTSEKLFPKQKELIEQVFGVNVFDNYGLNDGGISAYECEKHSGMHIDMERGILEVVDDSGKKVINNEGKILATSLYNYAMPFIRYDTGDLGILSDSMCSCGHKMPLLKEIIGRITDFLKLNDIIIGSPVLTVLMGKFDIDRYQIVQASPHSIVCKIIKGKSYDNERDEEYIRRSFYSHVGKIDIAFEYTDSIPTTKAGKNKFIINEMID